MNIIYSIRGKINEKFNYNFYFQVTEIQTIQIADGNILPKQQIPLYMIFPRLFSCPSLTSKNFKIEFEVSLFVIFQDDYLVTENFPITLHRYN